jgi:hypothetical protein
MNEAEEDFFEMANLFPADTGLPVVVWVSERGHARHNVRVRWTSRTGREFYRGTSRWSPCARRRDWSPGICRPSI